MQLIVFLISYPILIGLSLLPHFVLYRVSDGLYILLYKILGYRLKVVRKNLKLSFPQKSNKERIEIERKFYKHLCDIFVEMLKALTISKKQTLKRYKFFNIELINNFSKQNRSVVLMAGHYSSWEGMLSMGHYIEGKGYGVYTPITNKYFDRLVIKSRERHHVYMGSRYKTAVDVELHQKDSTNYVYGLAADQSPQPKAKTYWRPFMGIEVPVFTGGERMARNYNMPVVFSEVNRVKRGYYETNITLISDNPQETKENEITDIFITSLENQIKKDPSQYFWTHNRFKHMDKNPKLRSQAQ